MAKNNYNCPACSANLRWVFGGPLFGNIMFRVRPAHCPYCGTRIGPSRILRKSLPFYRFMIVAAVVFGVVSSHYDLAYSTGLALMFLLVGAIAGSEFLFFRGPKFELAPPEDES